MCDKATTRNAYNWIWDKGWASSWVDFHDPAYYTHYGYTMDNYNWAIKAIIDNGIPANLISYKVYRGSSNVATVVKPTTTYSDLLTAPGNYCYQVSALYDLGVYGPAYAGMVGESPKAAKACVDINFGLDLPFVEDWTHGQNLNMWTGFDNNWIIDGQVGKPLPAAEFKRDPFVTNYDKSITSFYINASKADATPTPYKIMFTYDLKLDYRNLQVKIPC
jgi:hypothetical protein